MTEELKIQSIYQLSIRKLDNDMFSLSFILQMTNGKLSYQQGQLNFEQTTAYLTKHGWQDALPKDHRAVDIVKNGQLIKDIGKKYSLDIEDIERRFK
jgi:hypothetical protein